jgi:hypothetical protein
MKTTTIGLIVTLGLATTLKAQEDRIQDRLSVEFRPSASFATNDLGGADIGAGGGFEATVAFRFMPHFSVYAGWGWNAFRSDDSFAGTNTNFEETGYTYGIQFIHPLPTTKISYMIRAGAVSNHIEVEDDQGEIVADSGHGLGWQAECGLAIPVGKNWRLIPGVRYRSLSRDVNYGSTTTPLDLRYISLGMGVNWTF